jgi:site-specific recombinase XerD
VQVCNDLLISKANLSRSDAYLEQLRIAFAEFTKGRASVPIGSVTIQDLERWSCSIKGSPRTRKGRIQYIKLLFSYARKRGMIHTDPAEALEFPTMNDTPPMIHTPDQVRAILKAAYAQKPGMAKALAIRYFAGLRTIEVQRLDEGEVMADRGFIEVKGAKSKTRQRRLVAIQPNLAEWLSIPEWLPGDMEKRVASLAKDAGVEWPHNVTRHSFCSYHLAHFQNAGKTAMQAGHSEDMLYRHYRELVAPQAAAEFWAIRPEMKQAGSAPA